MMLDILQLKRLSCSSASWANVRAATCPRRGQRMSAWQGGDTTRGDGREHGGRRMRGAGRRGMGPNGRRSEARGRRRKGGLDG
eukprot:1068398-Pyramimonas_sp.AAC.1